MVVMAEAGVIQIIEVLILAGSDCTPALTPFTSGRRLTDDVYGLKSLLSWFSNRGEI
jgi:hypothetical protein